MRRVFKDIRPIIRTPQDILYFHLETIEGKRESSQSKNLNTGEKST
jgi:hypothetical protein